MTGAPFGPAFESAVAARSLVGDSEATAAVFVAMRSIAPDLALDIVAALQAALFVDGRDITELGTVLDVAASVGLSPDRVRTMLANPLVGRLAATEQSRVAASALRSYPGLLLHIEGRDIPIATRLRSRDQLLTTIETAVEASASPAFRPVHSGVSSDPTGGARTATRRRPWTRRPSRPRAAPETTMADTLQHSEHAVPPADVTDTDPDETPHERIQRRARAAPPGARAIIPGVQVLFAFMLTVAFTDRFRELTDLQRWVFYLTFLCAGTGLVLLLAPASYHRVQFRRGDKDTLLRVANIEALAALVLISLAVAGTVFLITDLLFTTGAAFAVATTMWVLVSASGGACRSRAGSPTGAPS